MSDFEDTIKQLVGKRVQESVDEIVSMAEEYWDAGFQDQGDGLFEAAELLAEKFGCELPEYDSLVEEDEGEEEAVNE